MAYFGLFERIKMTGKEAAKFRILFETNTENWAAPIIGYFRREGMALKMSYFLQSKSQHVCIFPQWDLLRKQNCNNKISMQKIHGGSNNMLQVGDRFKLILKYA